MTRRLLFLPVLLLLSITVAAYAAPNDATQTLKNAVDTIMALIRNPDYANPATRAPLRRQIENEVHQVFDFGEFSSRTVGPRWKTFTPEQKTQFSEAFAQLLLNTYLKRIKGYNGETVSYIGSSASPDGSKVEVKTVVTMKDGKKTPVAYRMLFKNGKWYVYDVIIENISLVKNYRTQFQSILNTDAPDELTAKVQARAAEVANQKAE